MCYLSCPLYFSAVEKLLERAGDVLDVPKSDGFSSLHIAAINDHRNEAKLLLRKVSLHLMTKRFMIKNHKIGEYIALFIVWVVTRAALLSPKFLNMELNPMNVRIPDTIVKFWISVEKSIYQIFFNVLFNQSRRFARIVVC